MSVIVLGYWKSITKHVNQESSSAAVQLKKYKMNNILCNKPTLEQCISTNNKWCERCKNGTHNTVDCRYANTNPCGKCGKYGHLTEKCRRRKDKMRGRGFNKKWKKEVANQGEEEVVAIVAATNDAKSLFDPAKNDVKTLFDPSNDEGEFCNFDIPMSTTNAIDERLIYYDWLADSATTSHITNRRDAFIMYESLTNKVVRGVGNKLARVVGKGTIELISYFIKQKFIICLEDVLYIPTTENNLISLRRWDNITKGVITIKNGTLTLLTKFNLEVAKGKAIHNYLYHMDLAMHNPTFQHSPNNTMIFETFALTKPTKSWEVWHRRYGHISYSNLQKLYHLKLVNRFNVDTHTLKPDCIACMHAKQHEELNKMATKQVEPGELTHIDLWGKYALRSLQGNQDYIVFVDNAGQWINIDFLTEKNQAGKMVKNHLTCLITSGRKPKYIRIDRGKEFLSDQLKEWCAEKGIEIQLTAPYSPSQNGVAK